MLHIEKNYHSSSTNYKKSQVDIFKIMSTGRGQKRIMKRKHSVLCIMISLQNWEIIMGAKIRLRNYVRQGIQRLIRWTYS